MFLPAARPGALRACETRVLSPRHFLPPLDLMGVVRRSPYQTTFALFTSTLPKTTGTGRPSSAVGASKSLSSAAWGFGAFGVSAYWMSAVTIQTMSWA